MLKFINLKNLTAKAIIGFLVAGSFVAQSGKKAIASGVQGLELQYLDSAFQCSSNGEQADIKVYVYDENNNWLTTMSKGDTYTSEDVDSVEDLQFRYEFYNVDCLSRKYYYEPDIDSYSSNDGGETQYYWNNTYNVAPAWDVLSSDSPLPTLGTYGNQSSISDMLGDLDSYEELFLVELASSSSSSPYFDLQDVILVVDNNPASLVEEEEEVVDDGTVSLELVLSVDVSGSVDNKEYEKQVQGYVKAFRDSVDVQNAIRNLPKGMAVNMQFWGSGSNVADIGWFKLKQNGDSIDGLTEFVNAMNAVERDKGKSVTINGVTTNIGGGTDIKKAIDEAVSLIQSNEYDGDRLVIDVSGDGIPKNTSYPGNPADEHGNMKNKCGYTLDCPPVEDARDAAIAAGITINGLPINGASAGSHKHKGTTYSLFEDQIDTYYGRQVVGGTNSFTLLADGFDDFARAARLKILKEISNDPTCNAEDKCLPPLPDPLDNITANSDADNNGILDADEFARDGGNENADLDGDGIPNYQDLDDDGDNIPDVMELHLPSAIANTGTKAMTHTVLDPETLERTEISVSLPNPPRDSDGVGISITDADAINTDRNYANGDNVPDYQDSDSDADSISDAIEAGDTDLISVPLDSDLDNTANYIDSDSDNDAISDYIEAGITDENPDPVNSDGANDGADYIDTDSDDDYISDNYEANSGGEFVLGDVPVDSDGDEIYDYIDPDSDNDFISDRDESGKTSESALDDAPVNTDGTDNVDYLDDDSDNDSLLDSVEAGDENLATAPYNSDNINDIGHNGSTRPSGLPLYNDAIPDFRDLDSDDNGILDENEVAGSTFDSDQVDNYRDLDDDNDGIADVIEIGANADSPTNSDGVTSDGYDYQDTNSEDDRLKDSEEGVTTVSEEEEGVTKITITSPTNSTPGTVNLKNIGEGSIAGSDDNTITVQFSENNDGTVSITGTADGFDYQEGTVAD